MVFDGGTSALLAFDSGKSPQEGTGLKRTSSKEEKMTTNAATWYETTKELIMAEAKDRKINQDELLALQKFLSHGKTRLVEQEKQTVAA
jgi:hypothetical protein